MVEKLACAACKRWEDNWINRWPNPSASNPNTYHRFCLTFAPTSRLRYTHVADHINRITVAMSTARVRIVPLYEVAKLLSISRLVTQTGIRLAGFLQAEGRLDGSRSHMVHTSVWKGFPPCHSVIWGSKMGPYLLRDPSITIAGKFTLGSRPSLFSLGGEKTWRR